MTAYAFFISSLVIAAIAAVAGYMLARKWRPGTETTASRDGAMLRTLIDNLPDLIYVKDVDGRFLLANVAVARIMGARTPGELLGKNDFDFHSKELATLYHEDEQVVIEAQEETETPIEPLTDEVPEDGPGVLRVRLSPAAARAFSKRAIQIVGQGRPPCPLCGLPLDAEGHICPRQNGHRVSDA